MYYIFYNYHLSLSQLELGKSTLHTFNFLAIFNLSYLSTTHSFFLYIFNDTTIVSLPNFNDTTVVSLCQENILFFL